MSNGRPWIAASLLLLATTLPSPSTSPARAQAAPVTSLSCHVASCTGSPANVCSGVAQTVGVSIDVAGARGRGGSVSEWVPATIQPDLVTFVRSVTDASGTDRQTFEISRTTLHMTWRWQLRLASPPDVVTGAVVEYECQMVQAQF